MDNVKDVTLYSFPRDRFEALAMLYVENVYLPKMNPATFTPEALMATYLETVEKLKQAYAARGHTSSIVKS